MKLIDRYRYVTPARSFLIYYAGMMEELKNGSYGIAAIWEIECNKDLKTLDMGLDL